MVPFLIALQFLTTFPIRLQRQPRPVELGQALLWYPVVGGLIGLVTFGLSWLLPESHSLLNAALVLAAWVLLTGGLHLDGLGDTADAWVGGHGDRERTLAIMKDPHAGPMAILAICIVLMLKLVSIEALFSTRNLAPVFAAPILGRAAMPLLLATTPYVRSDGIGASAAAELRRPAAAATVFLTLATLLIGLQLTGLAIFAGCAFVFIPARSALLHRLGGVTGDCCGALLELMETATLIAAALSS